MTTILGIKTNVGPIDAIVIGSDTQMALFDEENRPFGKKPFYKIITGDFWALAHSGAITDELRAFYNKLTKPTLFKNFSKDDLKKMMYHVVERNRFSEVNDLNAEHYRKYKTLTIFEDLHEFLLGVNQPALALYYIDIYGNLDPVESDKPYFVIGSGSDKVKDYIEEKLEGETYDSANISLETALKLFRGSMKRSEEDIFTGGPIDLAVVRNEGVFSHGRRIRKALESAETKEFKQIIEEELARKSTDIIKTI